MIVATLGHVDHGKTALVRALTGIDADRLPEEKARGMTIDLGFAYRRLVIPAPLSAVPAAPVIPAKAGTHLRTVPPPGTPVGPHLLAFIDVPGHERFIRNMLAGVGAIDMGLLVVAADDGVMPQTREHVAIAGLLRLRRMALVVTRIDKVEPARVDAVVADARRLLVQAGFDGVAAFRTSPTRGDGIPALVRHLEAQAAALPVRPADGLARFAVDRVFTVKGAGTVVTGTLLDGRIAGGDELVASPSGRAVRVRGLRMHDGPVDAALAGQRCALNLAGVPPGDLARGDCLVAAALHRPSRRFDVKLRMLAEAPAATSGLQLHVGTACAGVRVAAMHAAADGHVFATLIAERDLCVHRDDRFVLRDPTRQSTLGGGRILDPFAPVERASTPGRLERLRALDGVHPVQVLRDLARATPCVDLAAFAVGWRLADAREAAGQAALRVVAGTFAFQPWRIDDLRGAIHASLAAHHARDAGAGGMPVDELARTTAARLPRACFDEVLQRLAGEGAVAIHAGAARLAGHRARVDPQESRLWERVHPRLAAAGFAPPRVDELAQRLQVDAAVLHRVLQRKVGEGETLRLGDDRYTVRDVLPLAARAAVRVAQACGNGRFTAAQFRDAIGTGRDLAIAWLDCLDRHRLTLRIGDARRVTALASTVRAGTRAAGQRRRQNWRRHHRFGAPDTR